MTAKHIVDRLLENDLNQHVKAYNRVQHWDKAGQTYDELLQKKRQAHELFLELGRSIGYERALARIGVDKPDVSHRIYGAQIGSTDNYKQTHTVHVCADSQCNALKPQTGEKCQYCGGPLKEKEVRYSFTDLHGKYRDHMLGVELNDGSRVWFDKPLPPTPQ
jgi:rRNA maturation protein Nop10